MAKFFKHVGEHNGKKVVIVQRKVPEEEHMASVLYSQIIPSIYHDDIMRILESQEGQDSNEFYEILMRRPASNGAKSLLHAVAQEGFLKKAPCNQIIVKPNASSSVRLDELNKLLSAAGEGEEAKKKLQEMENQRGFKDNRKTDTPGVTDNSALSDADLAQINIKQATDLKAQAATMLAEAARLDSEAINLDPTLDTSKKPKGKTSGTRTKKAAA
jgi:hypothetical protein